MRGSFLIEFAFIILVGDSSTRSYSNTNLTLIFYGRKMGRLHFYHHNGSAIQFNLFNCH